MWLFPGADLDSSSYQELRFIFLPFDSELPLWLVFDQENVAEVTVILV
jgi:hypothetical protein